jgi:hypothetical protein
MADQIEADPGRLIGGDDPNASHVRGREGAAGCGPDDTDQDEVVDPPGSDPGLKGEFLP